MLNGILLALARASMSPSPETSWRKAGRWPDLASAATRAPTALGSLLGVTKTTALDKPKDDAGFS